jgi:hypothetical protein
MQTDDLRPEESESMDSISHRFENEPVIPLKSQTNSFSLTSLSIDPQTEQIPGDHSPHFLPPEVQAR